MQFYIEKRKIVKSMAKDDSALIKKMKVETAEKRRKQDEKKRVVNRTVKSKIHTARVAYKP